VRLNGFDSWRMAIGSASPMVNCALWIRAAERLQIPEDPLVPGPLDIDRPPPPISIGDEGISKQWLGWWRSLVAPRQWNQPPDRFLEPAHGTPDPLGLAPFPVLAAVVARRWPQALEWLSVQERRKAEGPGPQAGIPNEVVRDLERMLGRRARPFNVEFILLPVLDEQIRQVDDEHYLVPERVYLGPGWERWLRGLVARIG
jgi:hypothetical protein